MGPRFLFLFPLTVSMMVAAIRPFTVDTVMEDLRDSHPEATRVSDETPPGVQSREDLVYDRPEGQPLALDVYRPAKAGRAPALLIVHGGGWLTGDRAMERPLARQLAARGYVAVPVSYRLGTAGRFPAPLHDLKAAVRWLRAHADDYGIDPARIAVAGGSAGGTLAALVGATNGMPEFDRGEAAAGTSSLVQAVVVIDGAVNFADNALIFSSETRTSPYWEFVHGTYRHHRETWLAASALNYVGPASAPVLFINSTATQPILPGREEMSARLRIFGIDSQIIVYPHTPHPFWLVHPWFERVVDDIDGFLRKHLSPR
jgi:acetyl esterase/lipase